VESEQRVPDHHGVAAHRPNRHMYTAGENGKGIATVEQHGRSCNS
jgi:hypothetical protein